VQKNSGLEKPLTGTPQFDMQPQSSSIPSRQEPTALNF